MTQYRYTAVDSEGAPQAGEMSADSAREATARLQERGFTVNRMERADAAGGLLRVSQRLTWDELSLFAEQLRAMVQSGLPLPATLQALAADMDRPRMKKALEAIRHDLERGIPLHEAVERRHDAFPRVFPALIKAGETSGNLPGVLEVLSRYAADSARQRQELAAALTYPAILFAVLTGIAVYYNVSVFPLLRENIDRGADGVLSHYADARPGVSAVVDWFLYESGNLQIIAALAALAVVGLIARGVMRRSEAGRYWLDWLLLHLPSAGRAHYLAALARMNQTLALLLRSRVPMIESLDLAGAASGSPVMQEALQRASTRVAAGDRFADSLAKHAMFGRDYCWLVGTAEDRGDLEQTLDSLAQRYQAQANTQAKTWTSLLNGGLILAAGVVVLVFFLSFYSPVFGSMSFF
jgi:type II secretory pathway component PulF